MTGRETVLKVEGLRVCYGRTRILEEVSLEVSRGSVYALLGRNGTGKTSLVRCLLGLQKPQGGRAALFGVDVWRDRPRALAHVGVVPEEPDAPPELTADALSRLCSRLHRQWDAAAVAGRLERFEVPRRVPFGRLSKGQKGGVLLSIALGHDPELLILDDPTLGLDVVSRNAVFLELIGELADRGTTVFMTTHDLAGVEGVADRVAILSDGRLALEGNLEALKVERGASLEEIFVAVAGQQKGRAA